MASRFITPLFDAGNGISPSDGAKLFFFITGTADLKNTFSDEAATTPNPNPVIADGDGVFPEIWITGRNKVVLKDKNNVQKWEEDPVIDSADDLANNTDAAKGSALIGHILDGLTGVPSFASDVQTELNRASNRVIDVTDPRFGATGLGPGNDDTAAIQAAITYAENVGGAIIWLPSPAVSYDCLSALVFAAPGTADGDGNFQTPATSNTGVVLWEEDLHSITGSGIPFTNGKAQTIRPIHIGYGRTTHADNPLPILYVGAIQTTGDARSTFSADIDISSIPGVNGQALLVPAGSKTDITNRENLKGSGIQLIYNRGSSGNLSGPTWRRDWVYDEEQYKYRSGLGRRDTGDFQMWSLIQGGESNTAFDHLTMVQGTAAPRNAALQFSTDGDPGVDLGGPDFTEINDSNFSRIRTKADLQFDFTGETTNFGTDGAGLTRAAKARFKFKWNNAALRFDGVFILYDEAGLFAAGSRPFAVANSSGFEQLVCDANGDTRIGITTGKMGFYNNTGVALQTGVAVTAAAIHAALVALNLITA